MTDDNKVQAAMRGLLPTLDKKDKDHVMNMVLASVLCE